MSRIAIIDTVVDVNRINPKTFKHINLCEEIIEPEIDAISHGTMCAMVLDGCTSDYELINIQIFKDNDTKVFTDIGLLVKALELCKELNVDIISLSAVTSILSDSKHLFNLTQELAKDTIIVSALDNMRYITVPTSYPHVLGVSADLFGLLLPGEIACAGDDPLGVDVYANCGFDFLYEQGLAPSNSFAVPVVAAYINDYINKKEPIGELEDFIKKLPSYPDQEDTDPEVPVVALVEHPIESCLEFMNVFHEKYETECTALSFFDGPYDVRVKKTNHDSIQDDLCFMEHHYKTDLIFVIGDERQIQDIERNIDIDVRLIRQSTHSIIIYDDVQETVENQRVLDRLHEILTSQEESMP